jgi:hypothetical protein
MRQGIQFQAPALFVLWLLSAGVATPQGRNLSGVNVCQMVPGEAVAKAVGGTLAEARPIVAKDSTLPRCVYQVVVPQGAATARRAYVIWAYPPGDFQSLRRYTEGKVSDVPGLGDGAYAFKDPGDGRFKIRVLKSGDVTIEATADTADAARRVAEAALASLKKAK